MGRLFTRFEADADIDKIWNYITGIGTPTFYYKDTERYWREFSEEVACAGFLIITQENLDEFVNWLENQ